MTFASLHYRPAPCPEAALAVGVMEKEMETTIVLGLYRDNGKENGNYRDYIGGMENIVVRSMFGSL